MFPPRVALILLLVELGLLAGASFSLCRRWGNTHAEAGAYALLLPLMAVSFGFEVAFLMGLPAIVRVWELILIMIAIIILVRNGKPLRDIWRNLVGAVKNHPATALALLMATVLLLVQLFSTGPEQIERLMPPAPEGHGVLAGEVPLLPSNVDVLSLWLIRFHGGVAHTLPAMMALAAIAFATYALARRYAWPPTAVTVTLMVISMPRLVCLTSAGSSEIIHAAACLLALLMVYRLVERPQGRDLFLLLMTVAFAISMTRLQWLFPLLILPMGAVIILRRHGVLFFKAITLRGNLLSVMIAGVAAALFVTYPLLTRSAYQAGLDGSAWELFLNADGIQGALANSVRYLIEAIHFTRPIDFLVAQIFKNGLVDTINQLYNAWLAPVLGLAGAVAPFQVLWAPTAKAAWFGPFGILALLPALLYALVRGPRRLKAVALSLVGYFYLMTLIPAWQPGNVSLFTPLFTAGGFTMAFLLPPWRLSVRAKHFLQALSFVLLFYSLLFNPFGLLAEHLPISF